MPWRKGNRLKFVAEHQAQGHVADIYSDIRETLGVSHTDLVFQAYGVYPEFLDMHWRTLRPVVQTREFFSLAERLRADSYTRMHNYFRVPDLCARLRNANFSDAVLNDLTSLAELWQYCEPVVLLLVAAQFQAFDSALGQNVPGAELTSPRVRFPRPVLVSEDSASPDVRRIYDDVKRTLNLPFLPTPFRAFGRWPDFLRIYWEQLKSVVPSAVYEGCHYGVRETAFALTRELPGTIELTFDQLAEAGLADDEIASATRITELFITALCTMVLNVAFLKIALEGGSQRGITEIPDQTRPSSGEKDIAA